jgi:putative DNA primase/helicase
MERSTRRLEHDVAAIRQLDAKEVVALDAAYNGPATSENIAQVRGLLERGALRATERLAESGAVTQDEADRAAPGREDDPLHQWQLRRVAVREQLRTHFEQVGKQFFVGERVAFEDAGTSLRAFDSKVRTVQGIVDRLEEKGWRALRVTGAPEFQRRLWLEASARGMRVYTRDFEPSAADRAELAERRAAVVRGDMVNERRPQEAAVGAKPEPGERGQKALESPRESRLVEHGRAHYRFDPKADLSYYVKIERLGKEHITWGKDLERAVAASGARNGDRVVMERVGGDAVVVNALRRDEAGQEVRAPVPASRGAWRVSVVGRDNGEAVRTPVQALVEKAALRAGASPEQATVASRIAGEREAQLAARGQSLTVLGVDPAAPRSRPAPTIRVDRAQEQVRAR